MTDLEKVAQWVKVLVEDVLRRPIGPCDTKYENTSVGMVFCDMGSAYLKVYADRIVIHDLSIDHDDNFEVELANPRCDWKIEKFIRSLVRQGHL